VDYEQVKTRVNAKYDAWQRNILSRFGVQLAMKGMHASILKTRKDLENRLRVYSIFGLHLFFLSLHFYDDPPSSRCGLHVFSNYFSCFCVFPRSIDRITLFQCYGMRDN